MANKKNAERKGLSAKKKTAIAIAAVILLVLLCTVLANATNSAKPEILPEEETEEIVSEMEEVVEEEVKEEVKTSNKTNSSKGGTSYFSLTEEGTVTVPAENKAEVTENRPTVELTIEKVRPTVENYSDGAFGKVNVIRNGKDITNTCAISYDSSKVEKTTSGVYTVGIYADCGSNGNAARSATIVIYIPKVDERPVAENKQDTTPAAVAPETEVKTDVNGNETRETRPAAGQEMTKIILVKADGTQVTFVKTEVENVYATQITKVMQENALASNVKINGNTLTIAGRTFVAE